MGNKTITIVNSSGKELNVGLSYLERLIIALTEKQCDLEENLKAIKESVSSLD